MEPEGSMPHSQGLSNNPYPEPKLGRRKGWVIYSQLCCMVVKHDLLH